MDTSDLAKRMKNYYETVSKTKLVRRMPVIIRIDGKAFHTFTRGFNKPFDEAMMSSMWHTTKYLCENIQNCVLGYTQSDEISLLLIDYKTFGTAAWFDNEVQKMCSISASLATLEFNRAFYDYYAKVFAVNEDPDSNELKFLNTYISAYTRGACFDSRCFNIPREEVTNYFYWRQLDATRNSIEAVGQHYFSHKELLNKGCNAIQDMLHEQKGINWNDYPTPEKRGVCCIKTKSTIMDEKGNTVERTKWIIDKNIPVFTGEGRNYIDKYVDIDEAK